ncbi:response regulator transcription factor [Teichococcus oryzae]|uniref:response regulator transcription factor n=1 Tax=Teichococcus oryzae TaxID=1608942 RepID=UPI001F4FD087|nr:response regulator [Pseudoroseomonas oryzae]
MIDDDDAVRRAVAMLLRSAGMDAETYPSGAAFLDALPVSGCADTGCILTDVRMPGLDGLELLRRLKALGVQAPVVIMTAHGDIATAVQAMKAGAADFVEKPFDDSALLDTIEAACGRSELPGAAGAASESASRIAELSAREREVLELLMTGKQNKEVARKLGLSPRTIELHRARMLAKLGVGSLAEAVRLAVQAGLGSPAEDRTPEAG